MRQLPATTSRVQLPSPLHVPAVHPSPSSHLSDAPTQLPATQCPPAKHTLASPQLPTLTGT